MSRAGGREVALSRVALGKLRPLLSTYDRNATYVPQANDLGKVFEIVWGFGEDKKTPREVAHKFAIDPRQGLYYVEAATELGFLQREDSGQLHLTNDGQRVRDAPEPEALGLFVSRVVCLPSLRSCLEFVLTFQGDKIPRSELNRLVTISCQGRYKRTTLPRRTDSVVSWLRWLENSAEFVRITR